MEGEAETSLTNCVTWNYAVDANDVGRLSRGAPTVHGDFVGLARHLRTVWCRAHEEALPRDYPTVLVELIDHYANGLDLVVLVVATRWSTKTSVAQKQWQDVLDRARITRLPWVPLFPEQPFSYAQSLFSIAVRSQILDIACVSKREVKVTTLWSASSSNAPCRQICFGEDGVRYDSPVLFENSPVYGCITGLELTAELPSAPNLFRYDLTHGWLPVPDPDLAIRVRYARRDLHCVCAHRLSRNGAIQWKSTWLQRPRTGATYYVVLPNTHILAFPSETTESVYECGPLLPVSLNSVPLHRAVSDPVSFPLYPWQRSTALTPPPVPMVRQSVMSLVAVNQWLLYLPSPLLPHAYIVTLSNLGSPHPAPWIRVM